MSIARSMLTGFAGAVLFAAAASAQKAPAPQTPAATNSEPQVTTASYDSWTLRCQTKQDGTGKVCEIDHSIVPQGQQNPVAQIAVSRPSVKDELHLTAVLPNNITLPSAPKISNGEKDPGLELTWRRCLPGGCVADGVPKEDMLRSWHGETGDNTGRLVFQDATGRTITVQFSLHGFGHAMDALAKEK